MKKCFLLILPLFLLTVFLFGLAPVSAQNFGLEVTGAKAGYNKTDTPESITTTVINSALALVYIAFFILVLYAGIRWMTAQGNEEHVTKAKNILEAAIIGVVVISAAYAITNFILGKVGAGGGGGVNEPVTTSVCSGPSLVCSETSLCTTAGGEEVSGKTCAGSDEICCDIGTGESTDICESDSDCGEQHSCYYSKCRLKCGSNNDCEDDQDCTGGVCIESVDKCAIANCDSNQNCDPETGACTYKTGCCLTGCTVQTSDKCSGNFAPDKQCSEVIGCGLSNCQPNNAGLISFCKKQEVKDDFGLVVCKTGNETYCFSGMQKECLPNSSFNLNTFCAARGQSTCDIGFGDPSICIWKY